MTPRTRRKRRLAALLVNFGSAVTLVAAACTGGGTGVTPSVSASGAGSGVGGSMGIPQPVVTGIPVADESERVDLRLPSFSNPTTITNPLFPVSKQESVLLLGHVDNKPFRTEVTLLPDTRIIEWEGLRVETAVSQYVAYLDGSIQEVAYDNYAQADDGSVWYFGEDVFDFRDGAIVVTEGTWLAGRDGPAAMIMPGDPQVGDVYRAENAPGFVFEEVTVRSVGKRLDGPLGSIDGGMVAEELHSDGKVEQKIFAPGYGEFYTADGPDVEALALALPSDAASGPLPSDLETMVDGALEIFDASQSADWKAASATVQKMTSAWDGYRSGEVPKLIEPMMTKALNSLVSAVSDHKAERARQAAIAAAQWSLDLELRYRPAAEIDLARLDLWAAQLLVDEASGDAAAVNADAFALDYIRDRILHGLNKADLARVNTELGLIQVAVADEEPAVAADAAKRLRDILRALKLAS